MLIEYKEVYKILKQLGKEPRGVFHVGAHECEELEYYTRYGLSDSDIVWIEGNEDIANRMREKGIPNIYTALIDEAERDVTFNITNNGQSSSILELGTHAIMYPHIQVVEKRQQKTTTIQKLQSTHNIDFTNLNFWNFDIQGAELSALKGSGDLLNYADALYLEVNTNEVYKGCAILDELDDFLMKKGFVRFLLKIYENGRPGGDGWGDALYVRI
jgi:FkbM family methyltransferase